MNSLARFLSTLLIILILAMFGCTSGGGSDDGNGDSGNGDTDGGTGSGRNFTTDCGTVHQGSLKNPISEDQGTLVNVTEVVSHNTVVIDRANGTQLVRLLGLAENVSAFKRNNAIAELKRFLGNAIFYQSSEECSISFDGGGTGTAGALFRPSSGRSFAENLLEKGYAEGSSGVGLCGASLVSSCYDALAEETGVETGAAVSNFLWKPESERDGKLVVLLNPFGATIFANGVQLNNTGPSNGRGTTARGDRGGCGYGANVKVTAVDSSGRSLVFPGNSLSFTIPNGCDRVEF